MERRKGGGGMPGYSKRVDYNWRRPSMLRTMRSVIPSSERSFIKSCALSKTFYMIGKQTD
eukprot:scaffold607_cov160-Ochromonas_danica.AAC.9